MKKLVILMVIAIAILDFGCRNDDDYVWMFQLYGFGSQMGSKMKGKVEEYTLHAYWAKEENGTVVRGNVNPFGDKYKVTVSPYGCKEQFNKSGTIIKRENFNASGELLSFAIVEAEGKIIKKETYYRGDTLWAYSKNTYTGSNLTEVKYFNSKPDTLYGSFVINYDQDGNRTKFQWFDYKNEPGLYFEYSYTYNPGGYTYHVRRYSATGEMTWQVDLEYNDQGVGIAEYYRDIVKGVIENKRDIIVKCENDKKGNWVKRVWYLENQPYILWEREIKYYD